MYGIPYSKVREILEELRQQLGSSFWVNKSSILFTIKAKYGDAIDMDYVSVTYDAMLEERNKKNEEAKKNEEKRSYNPGVNWAK